MMGHHLKALRYFGHFFLWLYAVPLVLEKRGQLTDARLLGLVKKMATISFDVLGVTCTIHNEQRLSGDGPRLYIANHRSWLDQPSVILAAPDLLHFLGKSTYFEMPFLRTTLRLFRCVPVDKNQARDTISLLEDVVAAGGSLVMYPEGTRSASGDFLPFKTGPYVLSARTGVPIVPLYIHGAFETLPRAQPLSTVKQGDIIVDVGEPFVVPPDFVNAPDTTAYRAQFIKNHATSRRAHLGGH